MARSLDRKKPFATIIGHDVPGVVYMQGRFYFNDAGEYVSEDAAPVVAAPPTVAKTKEAKVSKVKKDTLKRATSILGDLGQAPATSEQAAAARENAAAEIAESKSE